MASQHFDLIIVGAGPTGSTLTALLKDAGLSIAVIDKSTFPRDKVCGDAIPGRAVRILENISPETKLRFAQFQQKRLSKGGTAISPQGHSFSLYFKTRGYISRREDFDYFLYQEAQLNRQATFFTGAKVQDVSVDKDGVVVGLKGQSATLTAKLIIGCDGANSIVARQLTQRGVDPNHHCGAVRAYYKNVALADDYMMEFHFLKGYLPGYFWVFPLENGWYNVGFGMLSKDIAKNKINLRQSLLEIIEQEPRFKAAFANATPMGEIQGFGLPLGSKKRPLSGTRFLLCGDAASLIDPATGEGIGNALLSAQIAAGYCRKCIAEHRFDAGFLQAYDQQIYAKLWRELNGKYQIQRLFKDRSWLLDWSIRLAASNPILRKVISKVF